jgi:hypothetical protein
VSTSTLGFLATTDFDTSSELAAILTDETGTGNVVFSNSPTFTGTAAFAGLTGTTATITSATSSNLALTRLNMAGDSITDFTGTGLTVTGNALTVATSTLGLIGGAGAANRVAYFSDASTLTSSSTFVFDGLRMGIGSSTPEGLLTLRRENVSGTSTVGLDQFIGLANSSAGAVQFGNRFNLVTTNTATTTIVGSIFRIQDSTSFGNTVRGLEVQAQRGSNTLGENTALSGFARTFGVRGTTEGDAGAVFEPAGVYGETRGTTQGNAIRGYSSSITTASLLSLFQDTSAFAGTGLAMNFGNAGGSFSSTSSRFLDFRVAGTSRFVVNATGTLTIGDGTNPAGLQIGRGSICVDDDGSCIASTTSGVISADTYFTGNSDLAEMYFSAQNLLPGEIIALRDGLSIERADAENAEKILGIVSTQPGLTLGADDSSLRPGERAFPIALTGRVPLRLSTENGPIRAGDQLMLSSLPGVAMRATGTGLVIGVALEDFDDARAYSETFINQFGENLVVPEFPPFIPDDPRIADGCYYGAGTAAGERPCRPLLATTTSEQVREAERIAAEEAKAAALAALAATPSQTRLLPDGRMVAVGQIVVFVERQYRYLNDDMQGVLLALTASTTPVAPETTDTFFTRLQALSASFVDGVLSIFRLEADEVATDRLCVGTTCVDEETLRRLLENASTPAALPAPVGPPLETLPPPPGDSPPPPEPMVEPPPLDSSLSTPSIDPIIPPPIDTLDNEPEAPEETPLAPETDEEPPSAESDATSETDP